MASRRRAELNPKLHMDRQPTAARITDPSLPAGKRREIDNVMKKARANTTNDYWDKKLIEAEEKDPNRWRHTGYKKMYIQGESSSGESERDGREGREGGAPPYGRYPPTGGPPPGPPPPSQRYGRSRSPHSRSRSRLRKSPPLSPPPRRRSPPMAMHSGMDRRGGPRSPPMPRSPNNSHDALMRRPGNGHGGRPRSPPEPSGGSSSSSLRRKPNASRSPLGRRRSPPLPPPSSSHSMRSRSNSSMSTSSDDSCSLCSPSHRHRSRSRGPRSPPPKPRGHYRSGAPPPPPSESHGRIHGRPTTPPPVRGGGGSSVSAMEKYRQAKMRHIGHERVASSEAHMKIARSSRHSPPPEDPRLKHRPPEPPEPASAPAAAPTAQAKKKKKEKEEGPGSRRRVAIRIRRAPAGHFPEELATTAPSGMLSWDDVRVRYEYYKSRGYLRDLDLKDYIKWEEWWYKYQEWLKQERYYEYWDRSQQLRRRRKKLPVTQRLN
ncbi:GM22010 [Drosophila sechellia]|uniref:GM22010 n=1 Tax=Drosophila sechellia TaxID=7238 RepID=B4HQ66_DROSE|nr:GM22010 [Drosophila sechellia]